MRPFTGIPDGPVYRIIDGVGRVVEWDLKRKPVRSTRTVETVTDAAGTVHEVVGFATEPWNDIDELLRAKAVLEQTGWPETVAEWDEFFARYDHAGSAG